MRAKGVSAGRSGNEVPRKRGRSSVTVVGTGYVGLVTGACLADFGVSVVCADNDAGKIAGLSAGRLPIYEPGLDELVARNVRERRLRFTADVAPAVRGAQVVMIAVGTPPGPGGSADLKYVEEVARLIGQELEGYKIIVTKSTVPVGTGRMIRRVVEQERLDRGRPAGDFDVVSNPEFLREGAAVQDFKRPSRIVIGVDNTRAAAVLEDLYAPLVSAYTPIVVTTIETAELIKYASNAFLATKISFVNEIANLCESLGVDVEVVARAMGLDQRIGGRFLQPGPGFGGSCFPKDLQALIQLARGEGAPLRLSEAALEVNHAQRRRMVMKIRSALTGRTVSSPEADQGGQSLAGWSIGLLGLAFKPDTDDVRESPAVAVAAELVRMGAVVSAYDPAAMELARQELPGVRMAVDPYDAARGADALVVLTGWGDFRSLDLARIRSMMRSRWLFDFRNLYDPHHVTTLGFIYEGVGRPARRDHGATLEPAVPLR